MYFFFYVGQVMDDQYCVTSFEKKWKWRTFS